MAAATNKPGAVHYALIIFVMGTVTLGIVSYMYMREASDRIVDNAKLTEENAKLNKSVRSYADQTSSREGRDRQQERTDGRPQQSSESGDGVVGAEE